MTKISSLDPTFHDEILIPNPPRSANRATNTYPKKLSTPGGNTPYTKARRFLSTCEGGHLELRSIARVIILWENYLNLQRK